MEQKRIEIKKFVDSYTKLKTKEEKETMLSHVVNVKYIPYVDKISFCRKIIDACCIRHNEDGTTEIITDSPAKSVMFIMCLLHKYSCLDVFSKTGFEVYDMLEETECLDALINAIPQKEYDICQATLNMCYDDFIDNNFNSQKYFMKLFGKMADQIIPVIADNLPEVMSEISDATEQTGKENFSLVK